MSAWNTGDLGLIPGSGRSGEGNGNPLQYRAWRHLLVNFTLNLKLFQKSLSLKIMLTKKKPVTKDQYCMIPSKVARIDKFIKPKSRIAVTRG